MDIKEAVEIETKTKEEEQVANAFASAQVEKEKIQKYYQISEGDNAIENIEEVSDLVTKQIKHILEEGDKNPLTVEKIQVCDALVSLLNKYRGARSAVAIASKFNYCLFNE